MIATERNEMALSGFLKSFQTPRHKGRLRPETTPLKPKSGLSGPPARAGERSVTGSVVTGSTGSVFARHFGGRNTSPAEVKRT